MEKWLVAALTQGKYKVSQKARTPTNVRLKEPPLTSRGAIRISDTQQRLMSDVHKEVLLSDRMLASRSADPG